MVDMVSIAHYTVVEYLTSPRLVSRLAAMFALKAELLAEDECVKVAMLILMEQRNNDLQTGDSKFVDAGEIAKALYNNFDRYCFQIFVQFLQDGDVGLDPELTELALDLLDSSKPHFESMKSFARRALQFVSMNPGAAVALTRTIPFWTTAFLSRPRFDVAEKLGYIMQTNMQTGLLSTFLKLLENPAEALGSEIHLGFESAGFHRYYLDIHSRPTSWFQSFTFRGNVLEFYAQLPLRELETHRALKSCLDLSVGRFDPSRIMLLYVGRHEHHNLSRRGSRACIACEILKLLLQLGTISRVPGFSVSCLQIAVSMLDVEGVKLLFDVGADPNDVGDLDGTIGIAKTARCLRGIPGFVVSVHFTLSSTGISQSWVQASATTSQCHHNFRL
ncbi:hypothetical protein QBC44DRAFT_308097 [Cladorrhinum sp. PSN332]|nr:hypothetical protein QBC44DRAFT_308097 [Cladorrhinum sp. PSN332]